MKCLQIAALLLLCLSCKDKEPKSNPDDTAQVQKYTIEQFMDNESVMGGSFSHDNSKLLITSNRTEIYNVYTVPVTGGNYLPITASDSTSYFGVSFFPSDDRILLSADGNGDEISHIFLRDSTGTIKDLTPEKNAKSEFYGWAQDGKSFYFGSNKNNPKFFDVYEMDISNFKPTLIYQNNDGLSFRGISNNKQYMALVKSLNTNDSDLYIYNVSTRQRTKVNDNESGNTPQDFSPDSASLYYTTDDGVEFSYLMKYDLNTQEKSTVMSKPWDILGADFTKQGNYLIIYINEDGKNAIEVIDTKTDNPITLPDFDNQSITSVNFSNDEQWMNMFVGGSNVPSDLYTYNRENQKQYQLTHVLNEDIHKEDLVKAKVVRYKSFDGTEIPAIYYLPHQTSKAHKVPAMVWVHGGPGGQTRQNFSSMLQYIVNQGYAVLAVNNRGSSGYGKTFFQMDDLNHGEKDLQDCVEGKNWLAQQPEIDGDHIGIIGGSYGGYMTMAALTYAPEAFDVGVNLYGVTNWIRTLKSIPPYWESMRKSLYLELGDPFSADSLRLKRISPLFHTEKIKKPLMVLQGSQDPRVLQVESDEIVAGVRKNGVPVEYVLFEDEGHGFIKKENQIEAYKRIVEFLNKYLKDNTAQTSESTDQKD